ncbi:MAG: TetR/AcrR family transcriptional regulator [Novosphingobium sp.]
MHSRLLDAAEAIIRECGHNALTARTLADRLSLKRQIVHYYFESMDELLVQLVRRTSERSLAAFEEPEMLADPLRAIWRMSNDREFALLSLEFAALAARRPAVREVVREAAEVARAAQTRILSEHLASRGIAPAIDPEVATIVLASLSYTMVQEDAVGITAGHDKLRALVEAALQRFAATGEPMFPAGPPGS